MTIDVTVDRTRAATLARQRQAARRRALTVGRRVDLLDDEVLAALVAALVNEAAERGVNAPEMFTG